jgi:uncharacterized glyoxalase superfamily protein PhnB
MPVQRYLFFDSRCQEAIDFYRKARRGSGSPASAKPLARS